MVFPLQIAQWRYEGRRQDIFSSKDPWLVSQITPGTHVIVGNLHDPDLSLCDFIALLIYNEAIFIF